MARRDLTGRVFGMLTVIEFVRQDEHGHTYWKCECGCGNTGFVTRGTKLVQGKTLHCPCIGYRRDGLRHEKARKKVPAKRRKAIARMGGLATARLKR